MSSQLKISADTSQVKKSILDLAKSLKDIKGSKVQVFSTEETKFIKTEMKKELGAMQTKLKQNRDEIKKMVEEQKKLTLGSKEELEARKKILESYKVQAKLAKEIGQVQNSAKTGGDLDSGMLGKLMKMAPAALAAATIGYGVHKTLASSSQYKAGVANRNRLSGLGVDEESFGSARDLARVGVTEQEMIQRRVDATSILGRSGTSNQNEMQKAGFERAFGLNSGTMTGISAQLRGSMGGQGANEAQMKLQASVFASGIEDAIGPYLQSATQLLSSINENGTNQTTEMTSLFAQLTKSGERTPELLAKTFATINDSVRGATGDQSAFLQTAFSRAGIGGGTLGGTKYAMSSGGIMGQDRASLEKRGYNKDLLDNMEKSGMFTGVGARTGAVLEQMRASGGLKAGQNVSGIKDTDQMVGMNNLANSVFGTKGDQGFDALMMLEKVQNKQMSQKQFDEKLKEMQEGKDPSIQRLDRINSTLSGETEILEKINNNLMEALGKQSVQMTNQATKLDNEGIVGVGNVSGAINRTGITKGIGNVGSSVGNALFSGDLAGKAHDLMYDPLERPVLNGRMSDDAIMNFSKKRRDSGTGYNGMTDDQIEAKVKGALSAKEIGKEVANALKNSPIVNKSNTKIQLPDGKLTDKVQK